MSWRWEIVGGGALRVYGKEAMISLMALLKDDSDYIWSIPTGWPAPFWIDVYPHTIEARNLLIELVESEGESESEGD